MHQVAVLGWALASFLAVGAGGCGGRRVESNVPTAFPYRPHFVQVEGSRMHFVEAGEGDPILLLHGNPTSSYLWRNVIPHLAPHGRVIAVDLIGMGRSDKPALEYTFADHARYVEGFIEALDLRDVTVVVHDWGSALGFDYAARHPGNVKGVAFMEAIVGPLQWSDASLPQRVLFRRLRDPKQGRKMVVDNNFFVEKFLKFGTARKLTDVEMQAYRAPFIEPRDRTPMRMFPAQLPIGGEPPSVVARADAYARWLESTDTPKLLIYAEPGMIFDRAAVKRMQRTMPALQTVSVGRGRHYLQEDQPTKVGEALARWYLTLDSELNGGSP